MREFYFTVSPLERHQEREIRVYGVEKGKRQRADYQEAARLAEDSSSVQKRKAVEETAENTVEPKRVSQTGNPLVMEMERMRGSYVSLEERQNQHVFQKKVQESRMRQHKMAAAYGKE